MEQKNVEKLIKRKGMMRELVESLVVAAIIAIFLRTFFFQMYKIPTTSMVPTLMPGDRIFVSRLVYGPNVPFTTYRFPGMRKPKRGDVIVFIPPHERKKSYVKRLIGISGDKILIKEGNLYINGEMVVEPLIARNYYYNQGDYGMDGKEITVPQGKYFFLGDNSIASLDSRFWGYVDEKDIIGKAIFIWWPIKRISMVE